MIAVSIPEPIERLALLGWRVYPSSRISKAACIKAPADQASCSLDQVASWAREFARCNWRVVMSGSGIWALDVDAPGPDHEADGLAEMAGLIRSNTPLPLRPTTRSGGGGIAMFFRHVGEPIHGKTGWPKPGLDPRRGKLSVTVPPSIHVTTKRPYVWLVTPWDVPPPPAPEWLLSVVAPPRDEQRPRLPDVTNTGRAQRRLLRAIDTVLASARGTGNDTLNREAFAVARHVAAGTLGETEAIEALYAAARHRRIPHLEAKDTIRSAFRGGYARPHLTEAAR